MRIALAFFVLILQQVSQAQVRGDAASVNFISYDQRGDSAIEFRTGVPPVKIGTTMLINSISLRQTNLSSDGVPPGEDLKLSDYGFSTMVITPWRKWTVSTRAGVNFANADTALRIQRESTFVNGMLIGTKPFENNQSWKYSLGVVVLGRGSRVPVVPAIAYEYESEGQVYQLQLGFPALQASYGISSAFRVGLFANFQSGSYLLDDNSALRAQGDYIGIDRIVLGTVVRARLTKLFWLNTRVGYSVYGKTTVLGSDFKERRELDEESGLYVLMGIAIAVPRL